MIILEMLRDYEEIQENIIDLKNNLCRTINISSVHKKREEG